MEGGIRFAKLLVMVKQLNSTFLFEQDGSGDGRSVPIFSHYRERRIVSCFTSSGIPVRYSVFLIGNLSPFNRFLRSSE